MSADDAALLASLPVLVFQASLLFCRLGAAVMLLPGLGESEVPAIIRLCLGLLLTLLLLPLLAPALPPPPEAIAEVLRCLALELLAGLWLGGLARGLMLALAQAGQVMGSMIGLTTPLQGDPGLGTQSTALGRGFGFAATVLVLATGLYALPLGALVNSYAVLPAGAPFPAGPAADAVASMVTESLSLALRLAAPFILAGVLFNAGMGLIARVAPQVQVFVVAAPAQIIGGLGLLLLLLPAILAMWQSAMVVAFQALPGG